MDYYEDNDFPLPGTKGATFSNTLVNHDLHHVIAGFDTSPLGECCVGAFDFGVTGDQSYVGYLVLLAAQFQVGVTMDPSVNTWRLQFEPDAVFRAFERGCAVTHDYIRYPDLMQAWMTRPLTQVRESIGLTSDPSTVSSGTKWCGTLGPVAKREHEDLLAHAKLNF